MGYSQVGKAQDFDSCISLVRVQLSQPKGNDGFRKKIVVSFFVFFPFRFLFSRATVLPEKKRATVFLFTKRAFYGILSLQNPQNQSDFGGFP